MSYVEIALIPARGGSVGIPRKNLQEISGKSLVQISIEAAQESKLFDSILVTTDDLEIGKVSQKVGAEVHWRNVESSGNLASAFDVVDDIVKSKSWNQNYRICYLQPTSPLRTSHNIIESFRLADAHPSRSCVSLKEVTEHPDKMVKIYSDVISRLSSSKSNLTANRQDLEKLYIPNGAIYIFPVKRFIEERQFPLLDSAAYIMDEKTSLDIDSETDLQVARILLGDIHGVTNHR